MAWEVEPFRNMPRYMYHRYDAWAGGSEYDDVDNGHAADYDGEEDDDDVDEVMVEEEWPTWECKTCTFKNDDIGHVVSCAVCE